MHSFRLRFLSGASLAAILLGSSFWLWNLSNPVVSTETKNSDGTPIKRNESEPVAVVELFTSEGCSSCPPADENLRRIAKSEAAMDRKVIPLSFHVDYWNRLGWRDPFSQAAFSDRQRKYAAAMKADRVYTPQMVVNGTSEHVGSDRRRSDQAIREALATPTKHSVTLTASGVDDQNRLSFRYRVIGPLSAGENRLGYVINVAVAADSESVSVAHGENAGRELSHVWVVKSFDEIRLNSREGTLNIASASVKQKHSRLIVYIQSQSTGEITGASSLDL